MKTTILFASILSAAIGALPALAENPLKREEVPRGQERMGGQHMGEQGGRKPDAMRMDRNPDAQRLDQRRNTETQRGDQQRLDQRRVGEQRMKPDDNRRVEDRRKTDQNNRQTTRTERREVKNVQVTREQVTRVHEVIRSVNVRRVEHVDFPVRIGIAIPRRVQLYPLPSAFLTIVPEYEGLNFFLAGDQIIVVDPYTYEIVAVLPA